MKTKMKTKLKRKSKRAMALILTLLMALGILPLDFTHARVQAANKVYEETLGEYKIDENYNYGKVLVPKADGQYPVMIYVHGAGGVGQGAIPTPWTNLSALMDKWVSAGYVDPMIVVMPKVNKWPYDGNNGENSFGYYVAKKDKDGNVTASCLMDLVNYLKDDTDVKDKPWKAKIDKSQISTIAGYSMGGAASLYAGVMFSDIFKNVGGFSPAWNFYKSRQESESLYYKPYVMDVEDLVFSNDNNASLMMSYGLTETHSSNGLAAGENVENKFLPAIRSNKNNQNEFQIYVAPESVNGSQLGHSWPLFARETFCFLYYVKFKEQPSAELIEIAVDPNKTLPPLPVNDVLTGTVKINGSPIYGWCLSAAVSDSNGSEFSYQWYRGDAAISGATHKDYVTRAEDVDCILTCVVTDKAGKLTGSISASTPAIRKSDGPQAPTGLTATPCTKGMTNGSIQNVTDKMEYSANSSFATAISCTGTEITKLAAGTYYVRIAETATKKPGGIATVRVPEATPLERQLGIKHNVEFDNSIAMHYLIPKSELTGYSNLRLVVDKEVYEKNVTEPAVRSFTLENPESYKTGGVEYWHFTFPGIAAAEMGNKLEARLLCEKNGETYASQTDAYSVKAYAYARLSKSSSASYKKALVDMLNYGAAAQAHFKKNEANPVNADLTGEQKKLGSSLEGFSVENKEKLVPLSGATAAFDKKNVVFDSNVLLAYRMTFASGQNMENVKVTFRYDNGKGEKTKIVPASAFSADGANAYVAYCDCLTPAETGCVVSATIWDGDKPVSGTLQYGIESYVSNRLADGTGSDSTTYKDLLKKMVLYGRSVKAHFE